MKIFWDKKNLWNKANNIVKLNKLKLYIPQTIIIEKKALNNFKIDYTNKTWKYILRPSFRNEDSKEKSLAWLYKSIIFSSLKDTINYIRKNAKNLWEKLGWNNKVLKSIIIQEFIDSNTYWVYFSRNPNNFFKKWYYEVWEKYNSITSWKTWTKTKLSFIYEKELENIWRKLERFFCSAQDIEFCIKDNNITLLQTRNISTWNNSIYSFNEINKINWIYGTLDFDELWDKQDYFSYHVLENIFNIIYIDQKIYFKKTFIAFSSFKKFENIKNRNLKNFLEQYTKYLINKIKFNILKTFFWQNIDKKVLKTIFKNYKYSFLLHELSELKINFKFNNVNYITKKFLILEKQKNIAFKYLEKYKKEYQKKKKQIKIRENLKLNNKLIIKNWIIIEKHTYKKNNNIWIYKWKILWQITDISNLKHKKNLKQILIVEDLNFNLYDNIDYIDWLIIKNGNLLSHNSIVLREYKIPSLIKYNKYNNLKVWSHIEI